MSRSSRKVEKLSLELRNEMLLGVREKTGSFSLAVDSADTPDHNRATSVVVAADTPLDLLIWTNDARAKTIGRSRAKEEFKAVARAHETAGRIKAAWVFLAHGLVTARRDDAADAQERKSEHEYLALLNSEYPLDEEGRALLDVARHPDPWVRQLASISQ